MSKVFYNIKRYDLDTLYTEIIEGVSGKVNKKALNEVLKDYLDFQASYIDLNELLFNYYSRIKSTTSKESYSVEILTENDFNSKEEFNNYIKEYYNAKIFKNEYDYKALGKVKQKYTGLVIGYSNGFVSWCSPGFNVYEYMRVNDIRIAVA